MITYKTWKKIKHGTFGPVKRYIYHGWFLLGIIPIYIKREDVDL